MEEEHVQVENVYEHFVHYESSTSGRFRSDYSKPSVIRLQLIQIEILKMLFTVEYLMRQTAFRKPDESLVCSDKTRQFLQNCIITFKNK
jgi:hypothetical protein